MKSDQSIASTTDTLLQWKQAGSQTALTASVVAALVAAHAYLHISVLAATIVAVALLRFQNVVGLLFCLLIAVYGMICGPAKAENASDYLTRALANITRTIGSRELIPQRALTQADSDPAQERTATSIPVLPPATNAARTTAEAIFPVLAKEQEFRPHDGPDIVLQPTDVPDSVLQLTDVPDIVLQLAEMPTMGRHAKPEPDTGVTTPDTSVTTDDGQLARAA